MNTAIELAAVEAYAYRAPLREPIKVAFGSFRDRPFVLVRVVDRDGTEGWGECWCNWPSVGAEHRARLVVDFGEGLVGRSFPSPTALFETLSRQLEVLVLQTGEVGPIAQALAGIDIAVWDMVARRADAPLCRVLSNSSASDVAVYVTGINPDEPERFALARQEEGHRAFKLKTGFGAERDQRNLAAMRDALGPSARIMTDANQAFGCEEALAFVRRAAPLDIAWLEEPMRVDAPEHDWRTLASASPIPLAGGENLRGADLHAAARGEILRFIQPDITKWGGFSGNLPVARSAVAHGKDLCPHVFGGGVALLAGLHLLAAVDGKGMLEVDCHANAGREMIVGDRLRVREGRVAAPDMPGLGAVPDRDALARHQTWPVRRDRLAGRGSVAGLSVSPDMFS
ncbi:MAG: mandelate racemase/muconate lactonizing enzyme family protein [Methylobacteriaceae bacterium]|nr:mandelate racemase/muconate lactonizing enzyme family protein [Methylobacteriaceae bacterium]